MRDVTITKVMNGYIAKVGCQTLVYETQGALLGALGEYLSDPEGTEKRMVEKHGYGPGPRVANAVPTPDNYAAQACEAAPTRGYEGIRVTNEQYAYDQTRGLGQR